LVIFGLIDVVRLVNHDSTPVVINIDGNLYQATQRIADRSPPLRAHNKAQKTATAGTEPFTAGGSCGQRSLINLVDPVVGDAGRQTSLQHPGLMQQLPDTVNRLALVHHELHSIVNHLPQGEKLMLVTAEIVDLLLRHLGGKA
jgi:hypothetical protein